MNAAKVNAFHWLVLVVATGTAPVADPSATRVTLKTAQLATISAVAGDRHALKRCL